VSDEWEGDASREEGANPGLNLSYPRWVTVGGVAGILLVFVGTQILTSPSVPGIPSGGYVMTLPLYVAVGIPVEGVILLKALDGVPDIFKTLLNATSYLTSAIVVARLTGWKQVVVRVGDPG
jgi:Na+/H+-dicarboxylate symporter